MRIKDNLILDDEGRTLILRGVNLGGDSKIPYTAPGGEISPDFLDRKKEVSFIGRPFPIEEAETHFRRLKKAGMTFLRFLVTWEAVEHEGPGIYDEAYLAYLRKILQSAEKEVSAFLLILIRMCGAGGRAETALRRGQWKSLGLTWICSTAAARRLQNSVTHFTTISLTRR